MEISNSVLANLLQLLPQLRPQIYFKSSLTALSHAMEDQVLAGGEHPLVIASFQRERFYRQEANRYQRIAQHSSHVYVLAAPEAEFKNASDGYETVAFDPKDGLSQEWHLVVLGQTYATCLICQEKPGTGVETKGSELLTMDQARRFEGIWTFDRPVTYQGANLLFNKILGYRPELAEKIEAARQSYGIPAPPKMSKRKSPKNRSSQLQGNTPLADPFSQRLVTYLQAGQHKLLKAYRSIAAQEQKERLINSITTAMRQSLDPQTMLQVVVKELGETLSACRCLIYRCKATDISVIIRHEYLQPQVQSLVGQRWLLRDNALFQDVIAQQEQVYLADTRQYLQDHLTSMVGMKSLVEQGQIVAWLMVPVLYQGQVLGIVEVHQCTATPQLWREDDLALVDAIAIQLGAALIQAETLANLEDLNQQLEALDRTRNNLIAIIGHELRTPLSTIQVCLESLSQEPDMLPELRSVMLDTALADAERLRTLVQDFLRLSHLESGRVKWAWESLDLKECIELAMSSIRSHQSDLPQMITEIADDLPLIRVDGEWLVELLSKLLDNACKFTPATGTVTITVKSTNDHTLEVVISDTGRGIEPKRLEAIFERFHQEEGALRRTTGGTGLGLAISRQIVKGWGGEIWATSAGKDQGSQFHFTIPLDN